MKMSWSPEGDLQFGVFKKKEHQWKYVGKESTHTPSTLRAIPLKFLNRLAKLNSRKPSIHYEGVEKIYPDHANALCKAGLAPPNFPIIGRFMEKTGWEGGYIKITRRQQKEKQKCLLLCCILTFFSYIYSQGYQQAKKIILTFHGW